MENGEAVERVASEMIRQHGESAPEICLDNAEADDARGDPMSAKAWRDIANEVERQLREKP